MKHLTILALAGGLMAATQGGIEIYTPSEIHAKAQMLAQKKTQFAGENLQKYKNSYTMLAYREATGSAEVHEHEADYFIVQSGRATIVTGGKVIGPRTEKPGEIRGSSIEGGTRQPLAPGDIVYIPAGTPHRLLVTEPFTYFVIKVTGQ